MEQNRKKTLGRLAAAAATPGAEGQQAAGATVTAAVLASQKVDLEARLVESRARSESSEKLI